MGNNAINAVGAIKVWCYWCSNWYDPKEWIYAIWPGIMGDHMFGKFTSECNHDMTKFYRELSSDNQDKLAKWVLANYSPFAH